MEVFLLPQDSLNKRTICEVLLEDFWVCQHGSR